MIGIDALVAPIFVGLALLTVFNLSVFVAGAPRNWSGIWLILVVLPVYFIIDALSHGGYWDLFPSIPWTLPVTLMVFIIAFPSLGFKLYLSNKTLLLIVIIYLVSTQTQMLFLGNLLGIVLFMLIGAVGFTLGAKHIIKHTFSEDP